MPRQTRTPDKPIGWMIDQFQSPPFSQDGRRQAGFLLRLLQKGETLAMPHSRPMQTIGRRVHELRIKDEKAKKTWRIIYRIDTDAILVVDSYDKDTQRTPKVVIDRCKDRLRGYDRAARQGG